MTSKTVDVVKMPELRNMARDLGVNSFGKRKDDLIREIQLAEGNFDCFGSAAGFCNQWTCKFRSLCVEDIQNQGGKRRKP